MANIPSSSSSTCDFNSVRTKPDSLPAPSTLSYASPSTEHSDSYLLLEPTSPSPPVCKKRALLIGIQNYTDGEPLENSVSRNERHLKGPHADVQHMRQLLLDCYDYTPDDITVLVDDGDPEQVQPTEENLIRCMKDLVADACPGDHFYLHFSGYGAQLPDNNGDEEDGMDECILTCDGKIIIDDTLNQLLVAPLPVGSTFLSSFDSCHSGTLLDLKHYRCNRVYVPWINKGLRRTAFLRNIVRRHEGRFLDKSNNLNDSNKPDIIQTPVIQISEEPAAAKISGPSDERLLLISNMARHTKHPVLSITTHSSVGNWVSSSATPMKYSLSPFPIYCTGRCREEPQTGYDLEPKADVISLSSTKDYQLAWENSHGSSMTEALIKVLRKDPHSSLKHVLTSISHELHDFYISLHNQSRAYKYKVNKINFKRQKKGMGPCERQAVEMDNFQNPQISSHRPLDMNRPWPLKCRPLVPT